MAGGDGDGNSLELMLDGERPDPPPDREQKKAPSVCRGFQGRVMRKTSRGEVLDSSMIIPSARLRKGRNG